MSHIYTYTGRFVDPLDLHESDICIDDIARALSMICRYAGHVNRFYSVAEHSVLVAKEAMYSKDAATYTLLQALLHDAAEAYLCDLPTPLKDLMPAYREAEARAQQVILKVFNLPPIPQSVYSIDKRIRIDEMLELQINNPDVGGKLGGLPMTGQRIRCYTPPEAEKLFLQCFEDWSILVSFHSE